MGTNWLATGAVPPLPDGAVQLWRVQLDASGEPTDALLSHALLSPEERERAARVRAGTPRQEFIAARSALRVLLGAATNQGPQQLRFRIGEHGKPSLVGGGADFNVAHSGGCVLLALSRAGAVGVDVERVDRRSMGAVEAMQLAHANFHTEEIAAIAAQPDDAELLTLFFRCWTRKEAVVKADGRGLQVPLDEFNVLGDVGNAAIKVPGGQPLWVQDICVGPRYAAALAIPNRNAHVTFYDIADEIRSAIGLSH